MALVFAVCAPYVMFPFFLSPPTLPFFIMIIHPFVPILRHRLSDAHYITDQAALSYNTDSDSDRRTGSFVYTVNPIPCLQNVESPLSAPAPLPFSCMLPEVYTERPASYSPQNISLPLLSPSPPHPWSTAFPQVKYL